jgi:hypothetical protein
MSFICSKMAPCLTPFKPFYRRSRMFTIYQACHHVYYSYMSCMLPPLVHDTLSATSHAWLLVYHLSCMMPCLVLSTSCHAWLHVYHLSSSALCLPVEDGTRSATLSSMALWVPPVNHGTMSTIGQAWHYFYQRSGIKHGMALCLPVPHEKLGTLSTICQAWHHVYQPVKHTCLSPIHRYSFGKRQLFMGFLSHEPSSCVPFPAIEYILLSCK